MAGGGQRGLSFVGEPMVFAIIATFLITILLQLQLGCISGDSIGGNRDSRADDNAKCDDAWSATYTDHDADEDDAALLAEPWCQDHLAAVEVEVQTEQNEAEAEAVAP